MDNWQTFTVNLEGGVIEDIPPLEQGQNRPGSLRVGQNCEPSSIGGYRKLLGYTKFDTNVVPGTGNILGCFAFKGKVIACREDKIYESSGSGWTLIHTQPLTPTTHYMADRFNYGAGDKLVLVDGTNKPVTWDGSTLVTLTNAPQNCTSVSNFAGHLFYTEGTTVVFSVPNDETDFTPANGAGVINTGGTKTGLAVWRDILYIFGERNIQKIEGTALANFTRKDVTSQLGIVDNRTIKELSGDIYYLSHDGVRTISGTDRIGDVQLESVTRGIAKTIEDFPYLDPTYEPVAVALSEKSQYRVFTGNASVDNQYAPGILGGLRKNVQGNISLEWYSLRGINAAYADSNVYQNSELIIHADFAGYIQKQELGTTFDGTNISCIMRLPFWPLGDNELRKTLYKGRTYIDAESQVNPTLSYSLDYLVRQDLQPAAISLGTGSVGFNFYDDVTALYGTAVYGEDLPIVPEVNLIGGCNNVSFTITSEDALGVYSLQNFTLEYATHDRR